MMSGQFAGRIALVTGASRGIGRAVALGLAREGATVVAFARSTKDLESLDDEIRAVSGQPAVLVAENIANYPKIDATAAALFQRYKRLDILVGNAAMVGQLSPMHQYTAKQWDDVMAVNLTANWHLIRAFDPLLRASDAGRAIFVTSGAAHTNRMYWGPYAVSKAGLERMVKIYANEVGHTKMRVNILDPGVVRTKMRADAFPGEDPLQHPLPESLLPHVLKLVSPTCDLNGQTIGPNK
ncbi:MAG: SDR family NAD(P)-dependent oxidoreductase [Alphaproteobacteria bacterium]|nr:SDR family NAD(P)-dependent oxidoreductase [Alphaproteobacteria bacterium]